MALSTSDLALMFGSVVGTGGAGAALRAVVERRRTARRDTIADRDGLIEHLETRLKRVEDRLTAAEDGNVAKALTIRAMGDHFDVLEDHIWKQLPPPPPRRPPGT